MSVKTPMIFTDVHLAIEQLSRGQIVAVPTETVYGLAGLAYHTEAVERIYTVKQRPRNNPLIVHYACLEDSVHDVIWTPWAKHLAAQFWPGPLTVVLSLSENSRIPLSVTAGMHSVAVRIPSHPMMQRILRALPGPLAAPSANISGQLSPTTAYHVMDLQVPVLDGGPCAYGLESTIVDGRFWPMHVLRPGALSAETIGAGIQDFKAPPVWLEKQSVCSDVVCPGQLSSHYAPKKPLRLNATYVHHTEGLLAFGQPLAGAEICVQLSLEKDLVQAAANLFSGLHQLDQSNCQSIAVMPIPNTGLGCAIMDRLVRACAPRH